MIDLSTRAEILHLMKTIQADMELSFVYITHDISTARYFTDRIAVMYLGRIVEIGSQDEVIDRPSIPTRRPSSRRSASPRPAARVSCASLWSRERFPRPRHPAGLPFPHALPIRDGGMLKPPGA